MVWKSHFTLLHHSKFACGVVVTPPKAYSNHSRLVYLLSLPPLNFVGESIWLVARHVKYMWVKCKQLATNRVLFLFEEKGELSGQELSKSGS